MGANVCFLNNYLKGMKRRTREKRDQKRKIIRMPFAIDPASDNEALNLNSGESDVRD